ncbi:triose-phosphate isomerase [Candidatus Pacearchaeota archaeon]|nr:triose-phosphate isomerase [Candidatus Pacearchaeota archaeon]
MKPLVVVNFKNYVSGKDALDLARKVEIYCGNAIVAVPFLDIKEIASQVNLPVYAQHIDYFEQGRSTGYITPESLLNVGVAGSLLNHSEHKLSFTSIKKTIDRCNKLNLKLIVCASTLKDAQKIIGLKPYAIAFEDPKLIATGNSIAKYDSSAVSSFAKMLEGINIIPLCGAGISSAEDVAKAVILGCKGVLVSSAVAHPSVPQEGEKFLKEISQLF